MNIKNIIVNTSDKYYHDATLHKKEANRLTLLNEKAGEIKQINHVVKQVFFSIEYSNKDLKEEIMNKASKFNNNNSDIVIIENNIQQFPKIKLVSSINPSYHKYHNFNSTPNNPNLADVVKNFPSRRNSGDSGK